MDCPTHKTHEMKGPANINDFRVFHYCHGHQCGLIPAPVLGVGDGNHADRHGVRRRVAGPPPPRVPWWTRIRHAHVHHVLDVLAVHDKRVTSLAGLERVVFAEKQTFSCASEILQIITKTCSFYSKKTYVNSVILILKLNLTIQLHSLKVSKRNKLKLDIVKK